MLQAIPQPHGFQELGGCRPILPPAPQIGPGAVGNHQRDQHVFQRVQFRQQVVELEYHAEVAVAKLVAGGGGEVVDPLPVKVNLPLVRGVERAQQVQQGALARAAGADDCQKLALADLRLSPRKTGTTTGPLR